jgi:hypothetical protein
MRDWAVDGMSAGAVAAALSGLPSTVHALATGRDPFEATLAAGSILLPEETRRSRLALAAGPVHLAISLGWGVVLARLLPRRPSLLHGAAAGLAIAALDLGLAGHRFPRIHALPLGPQLLDHIAFGITVAAVRRRLRDGEDG